jgi:hypothetical protein
MIRHGERPGLALEALGLQCVIGQLLQQLFERNLAAEHRIFRLVYDTGATTGQRLVDAVALLRPDETNFFLGPGNYFRADDFRSGLLRTAFPGITGLRR